MLFQLKNNTIFKHCTLLITVCLTLLPSQSKAQISAVDSLALVVLYDATGGVSWTNTWTLTDPMNTWDGVTINGEGRVTSLYLSNNNMTGNIPDEIGTLSNLTHLYLRANPLTSLPPEIGNLSNLIYLDLRNNKLASLPGSIGNLSNLIYLDLRNNKLTSLPGSIGNLSNLTDLGLMNNKLTSLPESIGNLSNLTDLSLSNNKLTSLPESIGNLSNLPFLYLVNNKLTSLPESIGNLSNLTNLNLSGNDLTSLPPEIWNLSNLRYLTLDNNTLTSLPESIGILSNLTYLDLGNCALTSLPPEIGNLSNLTNLFLSGNDLTSIPPEIWNLSNLQFLVLGSNQLTSLPPEIGNLSNLTDLSLSGNDLTSIPPEIGNLSNLINLNLDNNALTSLPLEIGNLSNLTYLSLSGNDLTSIPYSINLPNLYYLLLRGNQLCSHSFEIGGYPNLVYLDLSLNSLMWPPYGLEDLSNLTYLNLTSCNLMWNSIPIGNMPQLNELYINNNNMSFLHLESLTNHPNFETIDYFEYSPQTIDSFPTLGYHGIFYDSLITLTVPFDGINTEYNWYKDGVLVTDDTNINDTIYTFTVSSVDDEGVYQARLTHPDFPDLTFYSEVHPTYVFGIDSLGGTYIPNQFIMEFSPNSTAQEREDLRAFVGATVVDSCMCGDILQVWEYDDLQNNPVAFPESGGYVNIYDPNDLIKKKQNTSSVDDAGFNYYIEHNGLPTAKKKRKNLQKRMTHKTSETTNADPIKIAVSDTGIKDINGLENYYWNNPNPNSDNCLDDNIGYDMVNDDSFPNELTNHPHASRMGAVILDNLAPDVPVEFINVQVFDEDGYGVLFDGICGNYYVAGKEADIMNMSWSYFGLPSDILERSLVRATDSGTLLIASAGNGRDGVGAMADTFPFYPAAFEMDSLISVAATGVDNQLAPFSNFSNTLTDLSAPGYQIGIGHPDSLYNGTSYSTAFVTAVAASYLHLYPDASPAEIMQALQAGIIPMEEAKLAWGGKLDSLYLLLNLDCLEGEIETATVTAVGGFPPYTFLWSNGSTDSLSTSFPTGTHSVTVSDSFGYSEEKVFTIGAGDCTPLPCEALLDYSYDLDACSITLNSNNVAQDPDFPIASTTWVVVEFTTDDPPEAIIVETVNTPTATIQLPHSGNFSATLYVLTEDSNGTQCNVSENLFFDTICDNCIVPSSSNAEVTSGNVVKLDWNQITNANSYRIRYRPIGGTWVEVLTANTETFRTLSSLTPSTDYEYKIKTRCADDWTLDWSELFYFTTTADLCDLPIDCEVINTGVDQVTLNWTKSTDDVKYKIKYKPQAGGPWVTQYANFLPVLINGLEEGTTYRYKVKTKCPSSWIYNWSDDFYFTTNTSMNTRKIKTPEDFSVFPNPVIDVLQIELNSNLFERVEILHINGQVIQSYEQLDSFLEVDVAPFNSGLYFVKAIQKDGQVLSKRFVKR